MKKVVEYKVVGTSSVEPKNLPEGLAVSKTEFEKPTEVRFTSVYGTQFKLTEDRLGSSSRATLQVSRNDSHRGDGSYIFTSDTLREIRDGINEILGGTSSLRKLVDNDGDLWFEVSSDVFRLGLTRTEASRKKETDPSGGRSLDYVTRIFGVRQTAFE